MFHGTSLQFLHFNLKASNASFTDTKPFGESLTFTWYYPRKAAKPNQLTLKKQNQSLKFMLPFYVDVVTPKRLCSYLSYNCYSGSSKFKLKNYVLARIRKTRKRISH